jgi:hypothetical protein
VRAIGAARRARMRWYVAPGPGVGPRRTTGSAHDKKGVTVGFLDKLKGTAKQAANPMGQSAQRDKIMKINQSGLEARATVNSMQETGTQFGGGHQIDFDLTVHPAAGAADYNVQVSQSLHDATLQGIEQGKDVIVKVDPDDPQALLVWGAAG